MYNKSVKHTACTIVLYNKIYTFQFPLFPGDPRAAMTAVCEIAAEPFVAGSLDSYHMVEHTAGHLALKKLILNDQQRKEKGQGNWHIIWDYCVACHLGSHSWDYHPGALSLSQII